jgi:small ubiquitin-related modifier
VCLAQRVAGREYYEELRPHPTGLMPSLVEGSELILAWRPGAAAARAVLDSVNVNHLALLQSISSDFVDSDEEEDESANDVRVTLVKYISLSPETMQWTATMYACHLVRLRELGRLLADFHAPNVVEVVHCYRPSEHVASLAEQKIQSLVNEYGYLFYGKDMLRQYQEQPFDSAASAIHVSRYYRAGTLENTLMYEGGLLDGSHGELVAVPDWEEYEDPVGACAALDAKFLEYGLLTEKELVRSKRRVEIEDEMVHLASREDRSLALSLALRQQHGEIRTCLETRLGADAAELILRIAAAQRLQAAARGKAVRRRDWPWSKMSLKVVSQDGVEVYFRCKPTMPLGRLMRMWCMRQGVAMESVRFLFDGARIGETQSPKSLEMESGDIIDVMVAQVGD